LLADGYRVVPGRADAEREGTFRRADGIVTSLRFWGKLLGTPEKALATRPNGRRFDYFVEFLKLARSHGIQVRVALFPLQPEFEAQFLTPELTEIRVELSRKLEVACAEHGAIYRDFTDLPSFRGDPEQFSDGTHMIGDNLRRLTNVLFDLDADRVVIKWPSDAEIMEHLPPINTLDTR
jgi:hypothetical protein